MNDDSKWATYRNLSFAPIQITNLLQSAKTTTPGTEEGDSHQQNGKHATQPTPAVQANGAVTEPSPLAEEPEVAPQPESSKTLYRLGVGAAAFVGLSLVVVFLIRPNLPSSAAPQNTPTAAAQRQVTAEVTLSSEQLAQLAAPTTAELTQEELAQQVTSDEVAAQAVQEEATQAPTLTPEPTVAPTATPLPVLPRVESIPQALAYTVGNAGDGDIYVMQANKPLPFVVADGECDESQPDWSPDGKRLVFQSNCNGSYDLVDVPAGGGKARYLTATEQYDELDPSYSPDGKAIVFSRLLHGTDLDAEGDLWTLNIKNGHSFPLDISGRAPVWSADGLKLAFMSQREGNWDVYIHDFISGNDEMISFGCPTNCGWPEWSPDSTSVAFTVTAAADDLSPEEIWLWSPERRLPQKWISGAVGRPSWSSAGIIAYGSGQGLELSQAEQPERQLLLENANAWAPEWAQ